MINVWISAAGLCGTTILGTILGYFIKELPHKWNDTLLGYCAGVMLAARNPHALDLAGCSVMGLDPRLAPTIVAGQKRGLAPKTADELEILGTPIGKVVTKFEPASSNSSAFIGLVPSFVRPFAEGLFFSYPKVDREKCVGCGNCARSCPREQIVVANGKATIYHDRCIKCYCCHELCPVKAISFTRRANKRGKTHES